jgi:hypothetical protein
LIVSPADQPPLRARPGTDPGTLSFFWNNFGISTGELVISLEYRSGML